MIRHASHDRLDRFLCGRMAGVRLSEGGLGQARALAVHLAQESISAVYSSPLERTRETADALADAAGVPVTVDQRLNEIEFGDWTGLTFEALRPRPDWQDWNRNRSRARPPGGEAIADVQARLSDWMAEVSRSHPNQTIAAVSHADVVKAAVGEILGSSADHMSRFAVDPASVTTLEITDGHARLIRLNMVFA